MQFKKTLLVEKWLEYHVPNFSEQQKWIENYVDRDTAVARQGVENAEWVIQQEQEDRTSAEIGWQIAWQREIKWREMLKASGDSLINLALAGDGEDNADQEDTGDHSALCKRSE